MSDTESESAKAIANRSYGKTVRDATLRVPFHHSDLYNTKVESMRGRLKNLALYDDDGSSAAIDTAIAAILWVEPETVGELFRTRLDLETERLITYE